MEFKTTKIPTDASAMEMVWRGARPVMPQIVSVVMEEDYPANVKVKASVEYFSTAV